MANLTSSVLPPTNQIIAESIDPLITVTMNKSMYEHLLELKAKEDKAREYQRLRKRAERAKTKEIQLEYKAKLQELNKQKL